MKNLLFCILLCASYSLCAQNEYKSFEIKGKLIKKSDQSVIESATVFVQRVKDSSLVSYTITNSKGEFTIKDKTVDTQLRLVVSYVGSESFSKILEIGEDLIDLKTIVIDDETNLLDEVVILADTPVRVKKDTIEFNLDFFKTKKDASVEEALKLLPGVEIDANGKITINGKEVKEVLVDGKPFFGDDPTIATKNLTKEIIDKVQIVDTKTKSEAFTGEEGDQESKSINLTIKKDKNKGVFGHIRAGAGTDERYEFSGMVNYFDGDLRIGLLGGGNNINRSGFNAGGARYVMSMGSGGFSVMNGSFIGGGGGGINTSKNGGLNYSDNLGKNTEVSGSYFYTTTDNENSSKVSRENILPDRSYFTNSNSSSFGDNDSHRIDARIEHKIDSTWLFDYSPSLSYKVNKNSNQQSANALDENQNLTNESSSNSFTDGQSKDFNNRFGVTRNFGKYGAFLRLYYNNQFSNSDQESFNNSIAQIYGANPQTIVRDQFLEEDDQSSNHTIYLKYRMPLNKKKLYLEVELNQSYQTNKSKRSTFDENNGAYDQFNTALSTDFNNYERDLSPTLGISYRGEKLTTVFSTGYQFQHLSNKDALRPTFDIARDFKLPKLNAEFYYRPARSSMMRFYYSLRNNAPSLDQLRPFENIDDPLNTIVGNPDLKFSETHSISMSYFNFNLAKKGSISVYGDIQFPKNNVITNTTINDDLVRRTEYVNVNGNRSLSLGSNFNKTFKIDTIQSLGLGLSLSTSQRRNVNFNNGIKYNANNFALSPGVNANYNMTDKLTFRANYRINFNQNNIDLKDLENTRFLSHDFDINSNLNITKKFEWENSISFNYNPEVATGFQKSSWDWNSTLSYRVLKDNGTITFNAYDILNQRTNARRIATENYIQDSQSTVLQQYFLLGFRWNFNSLGAKSGGVPPPPPMMMRM